MSPRADALAEGALAGFGRRLDAIAPVLEVACVPEPPEVRDAIERAFPDCTPYQGRMRWAVAVFQVLVFANYAETCEERGVSVEDIAEFLRRASTIGEKTLGGAGGPLDYAGIASSLVTHGFLRDGEGVLVPRYAGGALEWGYSEPLLADGDGRDAAAAGGRRTASYEVTDRACTSLYRTLEIDDYARDFSVQRERVTRSVENGRYGEASEALDRILETVSQVERSIDSYADGAASDSEEASQEKRRSISSTVAAIADGHELDDLSSLLNTKIANLRSSAKAEPEARDAAVAAYRKLNVILKRVAGLSGRLEGARARYRKAQLQQLASRFELDAAPAHDVASSLDARVSWDDLEVLCETATLALASPRSERLMGLDVILDLAESRLESAPGADADGGDGDILGEPVGKPDDGRRDATDVIADSVAALAEASRGAEPGDTLFSIVSAGDIPVADADEWNVFHSVVAQASRAGLKGAAGGDAVAGMVAAALSPGGPGGFPMWVPVDGGGGADATRARVPSGRLEMTDYEFRGFGKWQES